MSCDMSCVLSLSLSLSLSLIVNKLLCLFLSLSLPLSLSLSTHTHTLTHTHTYAQHRHRHHCTRAARTCARMHAHPLPHTRPHLLLAHRHLFFFQKKGKKEKGTWARAAWRRRLANSTSALNRRLSAMSLSSCPCFFAVSLPCSRPYMYI